MYSKLVNTENKACPCWPVMKLLSFVSNAEWHCLSLQDYLEDIFLKFSQSAQHRPGGLVLGSPLLLSLLPDRWGAMHPQHVNHQRLQEKRLVAANQLFYRLQAGLAGTHPYGNSAGPRYQPPVSR